MTTERVGNARLMRLAALLRSLPRKQFDYTVFVRDDWQGAPDLSCGTAACALGWATTMPSLRRLGLHLDRNSGAPRLGNKIGAFSAAEALFVIDWPETEYLFMPNDNELNATPKQVAKKIEKFVAERESAIA